jgi:plastocyanin domain-containing protein
MSSSQLLVTISGALLIGWVVWYFFLAGRRGAVARASGDGIQRVRIDVQGGYTPSEVHVAAGRPVRLEFFRNETNPCTEELVLPAFGVRTWLAPHAATPVEFTPAVPGTYDFSCGMGMVHGQLVVEPAA